MPRLWNHTLTVFLLIFPLFSQAQDIDSLVDSIVDQAEQLRKVAKDYDGAINLLLNSVEQLEKENDVPALSLVPLYHKIGVHYYYLGDHINAEPYATKALDIRLKTFGKTHIDVARTYFLRGAIYKKTESYFEAKQDVSQAIVSMESLINSQTSQDTVRLMRMYAEYIRINTQLRNHTTALHFWDKSFSYYLRANGKISKQIADLYIQKGEVLFNQNKYRLATKKLLEAIYIYDQLNNEEDFNVELAAAHSNLAFAQTKITSYKKATINYSKAVELYKKMILSDDIPVLHQKLAVVYDNLLELSGLTKEYDLTEGYFEKSMEHNLKGWNTIYHPKIALLYRDKAQISMQSNKYAEALELNQKALLSLLPSCKNEDHFELIKLDSHPIKDKISFLETVKQKAAFFLSIYEQYDKQPKYLQAAFSNYQTLDTVISEVRQSFNASGSQFELIEQSYPIYEKAIQTALTLFEQTQEEHYLESAYHFAAKNKALVLLGGMQEELAKSLSSIPSELLEQEKSLKQSIFQLESELYDQAETVNNQHLKDSLFTLRRDYQKLINQFEQNYADYYQYKYGFDKSITTANLQEQLPKGTCVIEYFVGDEKIFVFTISKNAFHYKALNKTSDFESKIIDLYTQLNTQAPLRATFHTQSFGLFESLLKEALEQVTAVSNINHLVFIPDGILLQLPFDVLIQDQNTGPINYLLRNYSISYAYSNRLLFGSKRTTKAQKNFAGFGIEYDDNTLQGLNNYLDNPIALNSPSPSPSRELGKLQYSDDEIQEIADLLDGDQWINEEVTREAFLDNADQYAILHLATHGILNEEYPLNSGLVFTKQNDSTNYFLRAADLYNIQLNADMVVLSACNTGAGSVQKGEGVRSLARAFSYAGCPSLVASLWNASDGSTKDVLVYYYKNLKQGMTKDEAMRQAKLSYLESAPPAYQSPYFWSHLSVIGDSSPLAVFAPPFWKRYSFWGLLVFILGGVSYFMRRK